MEKIRDRGASVLVAMSLMALFCPVTVGYSVAFLILCWLGLDLYLRRQQGASFSGGWRPRDAYLSLTKPLTIGVLVYIAVTTVSAIISAVSGTPDGLSKIFWHFTVKESLIWIVLVAFWLRIGSMQLNWRPILTAVVVWAGVYFIYCVVQRQTGINWVHGFDAKLGDHRFSYGVYRVSGMMGHPLSLAYNMLLLGMAAMIFGMNQAVNRWRWFAICGFCFGVIMISGSRFPIVLTVGAICLAQLARSRRAQLAAVGGVIILAVLVYWEGSMIGRVSELFQADRALEDRFPRATFWRVHWQIFQDHPIWGAGIHNIESWLAPYYNQISPHAKMKYTAHNIYLQTLADSGLVGFIGLAGFLGSIFYAWKVSRRQQLSSAYFLLLYGIGCSGLIQSVLRDSEFVVATWLLLPLVALKAADAPQELISRSNDAAREQTQNLQSAAGHTDSAQDLSGESGGHG